MAKIFGSHIPNIPKNLAINGALDFWQRIEGTTASLSGATVSSNYTADQFRNSAGGSTSKSYTIARSTDVPSLAQSGYQSTYSYLFTNTTAIASPAAGDYVVTCNHVMEGFDYQKIHTKTVTFGFWFKTSVAGTYSFALRNAAITRCYVTTFTAAANTWEFKTITVTLDSSGTWAFDNTLGLDIFIAGQGGTSLQTSSLNTWQAGTAFVASTATNLLATNGATFQVAQFSIVEGSLGFGAKGFARQGLDIQQELALCQRYYEKSYDIGTAIGTVTAAGMTRYRDPVGSMRAQVLFKIPKRANSYTFHSYSNRTGAIDTADNGATAYATFYEYTGNASIGVDSNANPVADMSWHWIADAGL